jgi:hypothetical protein
MGLVDFNQFRPEFRDLFLAFRQCLFRLAAQVLAMQALGPDQRIHAVVFSRGIALAVALGHGRQQGAVIQGMHRPLFFVQAQGQQVLVIRQGPGRRGFFRADEKIEDVSAVIRGDFQHAAEQQNAALLAGEEHQGLRAGQDLLHLFLAILLARHEAAHRAAGKPAFEHGFPGMHALDLEAFVTRQKTRQPLVLGRRVEQRPVHVLRKTGKTGLEPMVVVSPDLGKTLRPGEVDGPEAGGIRPVVRQGDRPLRVLDIGQQVRLAVLGRRHALAQGIAGEVRPAESLAVIQVHHREGLRLTDGGDGSGLLPAPVAQHMELFFLVADFHAHGDRGDGLPARGVALSVNQELAALLGHAHVEHGIFPHCRGDELPHRHFGQQALRLPEREEGRGVDRQVEPALVLIGPGQQAQALRLDGFHVQRSMCSEAISSLVTCSPR